MTANYKIFSGLFLYLFLLFSACDTQEQQFFMGQPPERPNIVWISVEDLSPRLGCYGDSVANTPHIDQLASQGMKFTNAYTVAGVCAPNRSGIITGMYPSSIGTHHMRTTHTSPSELPTPYSAVLPPYVKTFTEYLRNAGYYTTNNSKEDYQFTTPVTAWDESSNEAHWRNREEGQPFFAVFNFTTTHESQVWPQEGEKLQTDPANVDVPPYYPDNDVVRKDIARHYDNIAQMDQQVGEILDQLEADGLMENTIIFYWSDHGDGLPRAKRWIYDSGIKVPLIVKAPGYINPGTVNDELISSIDFGPTVLSLAGVDVPVHMQGQPFLGDQDQGEREYIYAARDRFDSSYDMVRAVRDERFKYIRNYYPNQPYVLPVPYRNRNNTMQELIRMDANNNLNEIPQLWMRDTRPAEELYDTSEDPHEVNNLAENPLYRPQLRRMRQAMDQWMERIDDKGKISEDQMVEEMWPNGEQPVTKTPRILSTETKSLDLARQDSLVNPGEVQIYCATHGASIAYTTDSGPNPEWEFYSGPFKMDSNTLLRAKAIRYGYKESEETQVRIMTE